MFFKCIHICKVSDLKVNIPNPKTVNSQCKCKIGVGFELSMVVNEILRIYLEHGRGMFRVPVHRIMWLCIPEDSLNKLKLN
jgi:hypothetical protein